MRERRRLFEGHGVSGQGEDYQARHFENNLLLFSFLFSILTNEFLLLLFFFFFSLSSSFVLNKDNVQNNFWIEFCIVFCLL